MSKSNRKRIFQHPELNALKQVFLTLDSLEGAKGRFEHYRYLCAIYAVHDAWTTNNVLPERISCLVSIVGLKDNPSAHPIRIFIDATHRRLTERQRAYGPGF